MALVVGLGNPGLKYAETRHNVGFLLLDELAVRLTAPPWRVTGESMVTTTTLASEKLILAKPLTYMNLSGRAVSALIQSFMLDSEPLIVVHDDMHIPFGSLRLRTKGSSGGHNGVQSVIDYYGSGEFCRLKIGVGAPPEGLPVVDFVLTDFTGEELEKLPGIIKKGVDAIIMMLEEGPQRAMNHFNSLH